MRHREIAEKWESNPPIYFLPLFGKKKSTVGSRPWYTYRRELIKGAKINVTLRMREDL